MSQGGEWVSRCLALTHNTAQPCLLEAAADAVGQEDWATLLGLEILTSCYGLNAHVPSNFHAEALTPM